MASDDDGDLEFMDDLDPGIFEDYIAQRAVAFCFLVRAAETAQDQTVKDLTFTMMRKVSMSIKTPSTADLKSIDGN